MSAIDLVARIGVYTTKGKNEDRKILTLKLTKAVQAGERSGYIGLATDRNRESK